MLEVFRKKLFFKILQNNTKTLLLEVLLDKKSRTPVTIFKGDSSTGHFLEILRNFKNTFSEHLWMAVSMRALD